MTSKKILSLLIASIMVITLAPMSFATSNTSSIVAASIQEIELEAVDLSDVDPANILTLPAQPEKRAASIESGFIELPDLEFSSSFNLFDGDANAEVVKEPNAKFGARSSNATNYVTYSFNGTINSAGGQYNVYPIWLSSGEILQADLNIPQSIALDYDLYLAQFDLSTGDLMPGLVDYSVYTTSSSYVTESVGTINASSSDAAYALMVVAANGYSSTASFTLNLAVGGGGYDALETDENAFTAVYNQTMPAGGLNITRNLNTPYDNDWIAITVPSTYTNLGLQINQGSNILVEAYTASGSALTKRTSLTGSGTIPAYSGPMYFRITSNNKSNFSITDYNITLTPQVQATKAVKYVTVNGYCQRKSNNFADRLTRYLYLQGSSVQFIVKYLTADNYPAYASDTISIEVINPSWPSTNDYQYRRYDSTTVSNSTSAVAGVTMGSRAQSSGFDLVGTTLRSEKFGYFAIVREDALIYSYGNGELSTACDHNGACGYK